MEITQTTKRKKYIQRAIGVVIVLIAINVLAAHFHFRMDLTAEKRFTLASSTKQLLSNLKEPVRIEVFLKGEFPVGFRQLADASRELLEEFREYGHENIQFSFINPGSGLPDSMRLAYQDSLVAKGIMPFNLQVQGDNQQDISEKLVFPGALLHYKDRTIGINLLKSQGGIDPQQTLNNSEALLEYQFANAIYKIQEEHKPIIGYAIGHGESVGYKMYDALNTLQTNYLVDTVNIRSNPYIPKDFDLLLIAKPTGTFTDDDKLKIDQYVMNGGKILWFIDATTAEMDSLQTQGGFVATARNLGLDDILFKYGVRINQNLVQDLQSDMIPMIVGSIGDKPQIQPVPFLYFPLLIATGQHPIVKNMDAVLTRFASSIDTVEGGNLRKTVLLATSQHSKTVPIPTLIDLDEARTRPNPREFTMKNLPVAVLVEGNFTSVFQHRASSAAKQSVEQASGKAFKGRTDTANSMIVVGDADIISNAFSPKHGPLQMGVNEFNQQYVFANKEFFENCLDYLTNKINILETRNKELTLRLLDAQKVKAEKTKWQIISFAVPIALVLLFGMIFNFTRQRKYASSPGK
ncbi:gliding motility-associated ABC transporter substrate-binding protein GldG [Chitinophaga caeni]|uniref:Gliding motility-associated ABC transporter substrate-binding protein GldG n=1 Tax=Chitinophaga caeni TaxID=2029983 RepID=A0A291QST5_9BACT|nr:gliding motility-associated ABC transporter substrate-binding protein GldG [Chitinophaga caeni]ATL47038.1 gliding motility-associated ABC transporter substrate-binding protein GldG [Chitinophaga caeni]